MQEPYQLGKWFDLRQGRVSSAERNILRKAAKKTLCLATSQMSGSLDSPFFSHCNAICLCSIKASKKKTCTTRADASRRGPFMADVPDKSSSSSVLFCLRPLPHSLPVKRRVDFSGRTTRPDTASADNAQRGLFARGS